MPDNKKPANGVHYFLTGWRLILMPGIKRYVVLPLMVNIVLFGSAFWWLYSRLSDWIPYWLAAVPSWLHWLSYLLWPLTVLAIVLVFSYLFSTLANIIASPFSGLLAEQLEARLTGHPLPDSGLFALVKDTPRILYREWQKLAYYLPRALLILLAHFVPVVGQTLVPVLWFLFGAWMLAIQYCDYPFDNHKVSFPTMRGALRRHKMKNLQFGALVSVCTLIPVVNLLILPVAVCGATAMWADHYREHYGMSAGALAPDRLGKG